LALLSTTVSATERFVSLAGGHVLPFTNWAAAATSIQEAIDASMDGDVIWVTNGVYATGGKVMAGDLTNRVALDKPLIVKSVNGPFATFIKGNGATVGPAAVRCAWLTDGAGLIGFTLQDGATRSSGDTFTMLSGGGAWCTSSNALIANCLIRSNMAQYYGGGIYRGTMKSCYVAGNKTSNSGAGGGAYKAMLNSCTITSNYLVGVYDGNLTNCIVYFNASSGNYSGVPVFSYCCATPLPGGAGNINAPPQWFADGIHLSNISPCRGAGTNIVSGTDIFGQPWANQPSIGCAEWHPAPLILVQPTISLTGRPVGFTIGMIAVLGQEPFTYRWMKDGVLLQDNGHYRGTDTTNLIGSGISASDGGNYQIVISNAFGVVTSTVAPMVIHYVSPIGNSAPPYTGWQTGATNIQDAIDAASLGEIVLVTNGVYATGGKTMAGDLTNRVALDKPLIVISVNGPAVTVIQGAWDPATTNGPLAVRCAWLADGATLSGFTLQGGATRSAGDLFSLLSGGGAWNASTNAVVANCVFSGNWAGYHGGGAYQGSINNCTLTNNSAAFGGGSSEATLNNCLVIGNTATYGAGAYYATLNNCTVIFNYSDTFFSGRGAGTYNGAVQNSIVLYNTAGRYGSYDNFFQNYHAFTFIYSCTEPQAPGYPMPIGIRNINAFNADPQFVDLFHVSVNSPCRGAGSPLYATGTDIDGETWANPSAIGCDEPIASALVGPLSLAISLWQTNVLVNHYVVFGVEVTGRAARLEWSFGDGPTVTNAGRSISHMWTNVGDYPVTLTAFNADYPGGIATNLLIHVLAPNQPLMQSLALTTNGFQFTFPGQESVAYWVELATNLTPPTYWQTLQTIFNSTGGVHQITDSVPTNATRFYRVRAK